MINEICVGDIMSPSNESDVIIGMNSNLADVTGIGRPFIANVSALFPILKGGILSFSLDEKRNLHMLICHDFWEGGWKNAHLHVRYSLDYLWHEMQTQTEPRSFSIVDIGTGRVGRRDGANTAPIRHAMADSYLPLSLFVLPPNSEVFVRDESKLSPLSPYRAWHPIYGEKRITA